MSGARFQASDICAEPFVVPFPAMAAREGMTAIAILLFAAVANDEVIDDFEHPYRLAIASIRRCGARHRAGSGLLPRLEAIVIAIK